MITFTTLRNDLNDFIFAESGNLVTIWSDQKGPQPTKPYLTLRMENMNRIGRDYIGRPDANGDDVITGNREFVLTVQSFGGSKGDGFGFLELIRMSLNKNSVLEGLRANGIVYVNDMGILNLTDIQDTLFLGRYSMDILFRIAQEATDNIGFIGIVEDIEGTFIKPDDTEIVKIFTVDTIN